MGLFTAEIRVGMNNNYKVKIVERFYDHSKLTNLKHCVKETTVDIRNGYYLVDTIRKYLNAAYLASVDWIGNKVILSYIDCDKNESKLIEITYKETKKESN